MPEITCHQTIHTTEIRKERKMNNKVYNEIIDLQDRTNINNNNNNNNNNKVYNEIRAVRSSTSSQTGAVLVAPEASPPFGTTTVSLLESRESGNGRPPLPGEWNWCKLDLFRNQLEVNSQLKLAITILNSDKQIVRLMSALNSPFRHFKRNIKNYRTNKHYRSVELYVDYLKSEYGILKKHINASKVMLRNGKKDGIIPDLSVVHYQHNQTHHITIYKGTNKYTYSLTDDVSKFRSYRNNEVIASRMIRSTLYQPVTMASLGI